MQGTSVTHNTGIWQRLFGDWTQNVTPTTLRADALAGLLGAVLVLPQGIAFATLAGLPPEYGLYTAVIPCIIAALFGSSWHVMSGPTNANSLAMFAMLSPLALAFTPAYIQLALAVTLMVGVMQFLIGTLRLGSLANFISPAALFGFTSGAAVLIAVYALPDFLGLLPAKERSAFAVLMHVAIHIDQLDRSALLVGAMTVLVALGVRYFRPGWPFMLLGLVAATALATGTGMAVRTIGQITTPWPQFVLPQISWASVSELLGLAFALTIVALGQAISIAKAVAAKSGQRIDANREFRGQGLSNIVGGFFSCYVSCGSMNRSMPNLQAGARTPLAAVFSALLLLALVAVSSALLAKIPMAALAALLLLVSVFLFDAPRWRELVRLSRVEFAVALATLVATLTIRLEMAILLGTLLSLMTFLYRTSKPAMRTMGFDHDGMDRQFAVIDNNPKALPECPQLKLLRMEGEVYFGAVQHVADKLHALRHAANPQKHLLVMGKSMNFIDLAGAELWEQELNARRAMGGDLYFHRPRPEVIAMWKTTGFTRLLGPEHQFPDKRVAIATIFPKLDPQICSTCTARIFWECKSLPHSSDSTP
ncbi:MAG: SulP family inorganic anion transporter [Vitreoscilla sp.]|nr:SulP family inorganic anion transporter [Polaromonas sp.]